MLKSLRYQKLRGLHIKVCELTHEWPVEEKYELGSQVRRSSNSSPSQLAEKNNDRHIRNRIEGVNRSRGEARETVHFLFVAKRKGSLSKQVYDDYRAEYYECIRMLNGLERSLEKYLPGKDKKRGVSENADGYEIDLETIPSGFPTFSSSNL